MKNYAKKTNGKDSKLEDRVCKNLTKRKFNYRYNDRKAKDAVKLEYKIIAPYYPDVIISQKKTGHQVLVEIKGWFKPSDRTKMIAVKKNNQDADIRLLFQTDGWTTKSHKQRYSDWAEKHGFEWAVGEEVPEDWK